jgi:teichuronic acid biosynthesis glycosyltransferase TuaC
MMKKPKINKILYITGNYPLPGFPERGAFVETLIRGWRDYGIDTDVISPTSLALVTKLLLRRKDPVTCSANQVKRPIYLTLSNKNILGFETGIVAEQLFFRACDRVFDHANSDIIVGKFLLTGGLAAANLGEKYNKPSFADIGESRSLLDLSKRQKILAEQTIERLSGAYCVSERLADELVTLGANPSKILVAPNEADKKVFFPMSRNQCREKLGLPLDKKIIIFVGHFIERKGPLRVLEAISMLGEKYRGVFIGSGPQLPKGNLVLHADPVLNTELPIWLNAADVFCLPTLAEGHCNAIEEAKNCGLPIVSSNIKSVVEQLQGHPSRLVDPHSPATISDAIRSLVLNNIKDNQPYFDTAAVSRPEKIANWISNMHF